MQLFYVIFPCRLKRGQQNGNLRLDTADIIRNAMLTKEVSLSISFSCTGCNTLFINQKKRREKISSP